MSIPKVAIVGRPNVGKSSLFNRFLNNRLAVVANREGVTRDLHFRSCEWKNKRFELVDTGGFVSKHSSEMEQLVVEKIQTALEKSSVILFITDGKAGIVKQDETFARMIRRYTIPIFLVVNKSESNSTLWSSSEFWNLGLGEPKVVSALTGMGIWELLDEVAESLPMESAEEENRELRIAILGRPNVGKSTLVNSLLGENRLITSSVAGTTRDSIDSQLELNGRRIILTDTAGLRKKSRVHDEVEYFCNLRALEAVRRSDVCVLLLDCERGLEEQDLKIATLVREAGRGLILALNKWDIMDKESKTFDHLVKWIEDRFPELEWFPKISLSALTGKRVSRILELAMEVWDKMRTVLGRDLVVEYFKEAIATHPHPPSSKGKVQLERCCQVAVNPIALAIEVEHPDRVITSYIRYLHRAAMKRFDLMGVPLRIYLRKRLELRSDEELHDYIGRYLVDASEQGKEVKNA